MAGGRAGRRHWDQIEGGCAWPRGPGPGGRHRRRVRHHRRRVGIAFIVAGPLLWHAFLSLLDVVLCGIIGGTDVREPSADREDGAVVVEFAIVFVLFVVLLSALIQYGVIFAAQQSMAHTAAEAARSVVNVADTGTNGTADEAEDAIATVLQGGLQWLDGSVDAADGREVDYTVNCDGCADGDVTPDGDTVCATCIEVTITFNWQDDRLVPQILPVPTPSRLSSAANVQYQ